MKRASLKSSTSTKLIPDSSEVPKIVLGANFFGTGVKLTVCYLVHQKLVHSERHFSAPNTKKGTPGQYASSVRHFSDSKHPKSVQSLPKVLRVLPDESGITDQCS